MGYKNIPHTFFSPHRTPVYLLSDYVWVQLVRPHGARYIRAHAFNKLVALNKPGRFVVGSWQHVVLYAKISERFQISSDLEIWATHELKRHIQIDDASIQPPHSRVTHVVGRWSYSSVCTILRFRPPGAAGCPSPPTPTAIPITPGDNC